MFSYEFYEVLHLFCIVLFAGSLGISFALEPPPKWAKILTGVVSVLIFVAGMGLMARLGIGHQGQWPGWIMVKLTLWLILAVSAPILSKRLKGPARMQAFFGLMVVFAILVYLGVYQPF